MEPDGSPREVEGVLNPGIARDRNGVLLMYPRMVARGNVSRIGLARGVEGKSGPEFERVGVALEAAAPYERRAGAHGCEDARVTFVPMLDLYVMTYTAYGEAGPRIALAVSVDGYIWRRLGLADFTSFRIVGETIRMPHSSPSRSYHPRGCRRSHSTTARCCRAA